MSGNVNVVRSVHLQILASINITRYESKPMRNYYLCRSRIAGILFILFSSSIIVNAQTIQGGLVSTMPGMGTAANYYFAKQGDITIIVNIWGDVDKPGRYEVSSTMNLINLLSLAGGPKRDAKLGEVRITRSFGTDSTVHRVNLKVNLEDLTKVRESDLMLYPGDTIFLERSSWSAFLDVFAVVTPIVTLSLAVVQMIYILSR